MTRCPPRLQAMGAARMGGQVKTEVTTVLQTPPPLNPPLKRPPASYRHQTSPTDESPLKAHKRRNSRPSSASTRRSRRTRTPPGMRLDGTSRSWFHPYTSDELSAAR